MIIFMYMDEWRNNIITNICIDFEIVFLFNNKTSLKYIWSMSDDDYIFIFYGLYNVI